MHKNSPRHSWYGSAQGSWLRLRHRSDVLGWQTLGWIALYLCLGTSLGVEGLVLAQQVPPSQLPPLEQRPPLGRFGTGTSGPPGVQQPPQLGEQPAAPPQRVLPPLPPVPAEPAQQTFPQVRVFLRQVDLVGNTVFSQEELAKITAPYLGREVTTADLEELRLALTRFYIDHGYINSGAVIPDQTVQNGVVTFQIIEGELTTIHIDNTRWFQPRYIRRRLELGVGPPLYLGMLQERLQFLQQDERIRRLQAELRPGIRRGDSVLNVRVEEAIPLQVELNINNYQSPTVGAENGSITLAHRNLTGRGDILSVTYSRSEGNDIQIDAHYTLPLNVYDTLLRLQYRRNDFTVVEEPFASLDVESQSEVAGVTLRHPFYHTLRQELAATLTGERLHNETALQGAPFPFSAGADNGESDVTAIRLALEWTDRTLEQVLALRSRLTIGINALGATIHDSRATPDGEFFAWLGQFQWARRFTEWGLQAITRVDVQISTDPLLSLEQIAVGGRYSVRGYRENQLVRDNGVIASMETRIPVIRNTAWADFVQLAPFVDIGSAWNTRVETPEPHTLVSAGIGLRWALTFSKPVPWQPSFEVYWGYAFEDVATEGGNLQDLGVHFQFALAGF